jgi:glutathione S-transferase
MDRLYYAPGAASMLVHWLLIELDVPHQLQLVDTAAGAQKSPEYLALNPYGVVPTLVHDGQPMIEAAAIAMTLADRHPQAELAPSIDSPLRPLYTQWMFHLANAVQPLFRLWWYPHEPAGEAHADTVRAHVVPRIEAEWSRIDAWLGERGPFLLGTRPTAADFYLAMLLRWSRNMPNPAANWPRLAALAHAMAARPSFQAMCLREGIGGWP